MAQAFQVDLRGLVDLLSHHLYSGPEVFVRELLQNAVDALTAAGAPDSEPVIVDVQRTASGQSVVSVHDDGIGLTVADVHELLATIGASSKRDDLLNGRADFLGRFGIGLLSCFMVTDEVVVVTRSRSGGPCVTWTGHADGSYEVVELPEGQGRSLPGSSVTLVARPGLEEVAHPVRVRDLARRYAGLLGRRIVIHHDGAETVIGGRPLPWLEPGADLLDLGKELLGETFLDAIPLSLPAAGLTGVAYVLPTSPSPQSRQRNSVYLKRMLLSDSIDRLAPDWAFFVRVVVDSDTLRPLASREGLYEDETLSIVRQAIGAEIRSWLVHLADHDAERLQKIVRVHSRALKAMAVHDDELLGLFASWLPLETAMGRMSAREAATRSPLLKYAETTDTFRQLAQVAAAQGVLLVNAGYTYDAEILARLPRVIPGLVTEAVDARDLLDQLDEVSGVDRARAAALAQRGTRLLAALGCDVTVREFSPTSLPCLYLVGENARFQRSASEVANAAGGFWGTLVNTVASADTSEQPQLCLNFRHSIVPSLVDRDDAGLKTALEVLYLQALLMGRHPLQGREVSLLGNALVRLLEAGAP